MKAQVGYRPDRVAKRATCQYWTNADVASLILTSPLSGATPLLNLQELLQKIMDCEKGELINARHLPKIVTAIAHAPATVMRFERRRPSSEKDMAPLIAYAFRCTQVLTLEIDWFNGDVTDRAQMRQWNLSQRKAKPGTQTRARPCSQRCYSHGGSRASVNQMRGPPKNEKYYGLCDESRELALDIKTVMHGQYWHA